MPNPNVTVSPNMSLPVPNLADPGPDYAENVNASLNIVDGHTHTGAPTDGKQLDLSTQLCAGDVQLNDHNLGTTRSVEFQSQPSNLVGSQDVNCLCVVNGVLGFNNSSGTFIPLTSGSAQPVVNNFTAVSVNTNHTILATDTINFVGCDSSGGAIAITLPRASTILPTPAWRFYLIEDTAGSAATHNITIQVTGGSGDTFKPSTATSIKITSNYGRIGVVTDGVSLWYAYTQNQFGANDVLQFQTNSTLNMVGAALTSDAASSMTWTGSTINGVGALIALLGSGTVLIGASNTLVIDAPIGSETTTALNYKTATITVATSGTTTLTGAQYSSPLIVCAAVTLTGDITIAFPSVPGAIWHITMNQLVTGGHAVNITVGSSGSQTVTGANMYIIACTAANTFVFK